VAEPVSYDKLFSESWQNFFDLIKTIEDPENRGTKWVYGSFPDARFNDKSAYPIIVIQPVDVSAYDYLTLGASPEKEITLPVEINIFSLKAEQLDLLTDAIFKKIEDSMGTLFSNNLKNVEILRSSYSNVVRGGMKVHLKSLVYGFKFNFTGS